MIGPAKNRLHDYEAEASPFGKTPQAAIRLKFRPCEIPPRLPNAKSLDHGLRFPSASPTRRSSSDREIVGSRRRAAISFQKSSLSPSASCS